MSDALERLKRKKKPKVTPRNTKVEPISKDIQASRHIDSQISRHVDAETPVQLNATGTSESKGSNHTDIQMSRHTDSQTSGHIGVGTSLRPNSPNMGGAEDSSHTDIQISRHTDSQTSGSPFALSSDVEEQEVKRSTFRLETGLLSRLHRLCQANGISREVMIESMFEYVEQNPDALDQVIEVAKLKHDYRQQIANRKRAKSMIEKFG